MYRSKYLLAPPKACCLSTEQTQHFKTHRRNKNTFESSDLPKRYLVKRGGGGLSRPFWRKQWQIKSSSADPGNHQVVFLDVVFTWFYKYLPPAGKTNKKQTTNNTRTITTITNKTRRRTTTTTTTTTKKGERKRKHKKKRRKKEKQKKYHQWQPPQRSSRWVFHRPSLNDTKSRKKKDFPSLFVAMAGVSLASRRKWCIQKNAYMKMIEFDDIQLVKTANVSSSPCLRLPNTAGVFEQNEGRSWDPEVKEITLATLTDRDMFHANKP